MTAGLFYAPQEGRGPAPVERWNPPFCGDSRMRIARDGTWFHDGAVIARPELVRLFAGLLRKDAEGYVLVTPAEKLAIAVEDVPFLAVTLEREGEMMVFTTNMGDRVVLDRARPLIMRAGAPYIEVRHGLEARIARNVYYQLADMAEQRGEMLGVVSGGAFFPLGPA